MSDESKRGTGRTSRALLQAFVRAAEGNTVHFVTPYPHAARGIIESLGVAARSRDYQVGSGRVRIVKPDADRLRGLPARSVVYDHDCGEAWRCPLCGDAHGTQESDARPRIVGCPRLAGTDYVVMTDARGHMLGRVENVGRGDA